MSTAHPSCYRSRAVSASTLPDFSLSLETSLFDQLNALHVSAVVQAAALDQALRGQMGAIERELVLLQVESVVYSNSVQDLQTALGDFKTAYLAFWSTADAMALYVGANAAGFEPPFSALVKGLAATALPPPPAITSIALPAPDLSLSVVIGSWCSMSSPRMPTDDELTPTA